MFAGNFKQWEQEKVIYPKSIIKGLEYIRNTDFSKVEDGKYEIDGEKIFAFVATLDTKLKEEGKPEAHEKYIDIQYLLSGEEYIGYARLSDDMTVIENYLEEKDLLFFNQDLENETDIVLQEGDFAVFFPADVHRPLCERNNCKKVRKVIVKIHIDTL